MYGGRVTDDCDRRIVETYMQEYLGDFLFDTFQPFRFFQVGIIYFVFTNSNAAISSSFLLPLLPRCCYELRPDPSPYSPPPRPRRLLPHLQAASVVRSSPASPPALRLGGAE